MLFRVLYPIFLDILYISLAVFLLVNHGDNHRWRIPRWLPSGHPS